MDRYAPPGCVGEGGDVVEPDMYPLEPVTIRHYDGVIETVWYCKSCVEACENDGVGGAAGIKLDFEVVEFPRRRIAVIDWTTIRTSDRIKIVPRVMAEIVKYLDSENLFRVRRAYSFLWPERA